MPGFLRIDSMVSGSSPPSIKLSHRVRRVASSHVIPGVGITRCDHIERKDLDTARSAKSFSVSKFLPFTYRVESCVGVFVCVYVCVCVCVCLCV